MLEMSKQIRDTCKIYPVGVGKKIDFPFLKEMAKNAKSQYFIFDGAPKQEDSKELIYITNR